MRALLTGRQLKIRPNVRSYSRAMTFIAPSEIRKPFVEKLFQSHEQEVKHFHPLVDENKVINLETVDPEHAGIAALNLSPLEEATLSSPGDHYSKEQLTEVHHGAIRLGTPEEMNGIARLFRVMDMYPVNYYNLTVAGLPGHSTAFRPVTEEELNKNPFRIFVSVLREDLIPNEVRDEVREALSRRNIITPEAFELISMHEKNGGLTENQAADFINHALHTFKRHEEANVSKEFYERLLKINSLLADVVAFKTPHINHLTLKSYNIDELQYRLNKMGIATTPIIQGPPKREFPILLRQGSFQAIEDTFKFPDGKGGYEIGKHRARFGEYETKGDCALTKKGRELYDKLLSNTSKKTNEKNPDYVKVLEEEFKQFPDDLEIMRKQGLVYLTYSPTEKGLANKGKLPQDFELLIQEGYVSYKPVPYHDFLPFSAAGIFKSNGVEGSKVDPKLTEDRKGELERAIGQPILDSFAMYAAVEARSILSTTKELGVKLPSSRIEELNMIKKNDPALSAQKKRLEIE
jgi:uncharacterized glyoxalase superfamily metalloenzyme YdcJ